jgi:hypothetical protein
MKSKFQGSYHQGSPPAQFGTFRKVPETISAFTEEEEEPEWTEVQLEEARLRYQAQQANQWYFNMNPKPGE